MKLKILAQNLVVVLIFLGEGGATSTLVDVVIGDITTCVVWEQEKVRRGAPRCVFFLVEVVVKGNKQQRKRKSYNSRMKKKKKRKKGKKKLKKNK
jgi:hypothetical protein